MGCRSSNWRNWAYGTLLFRKRSLAICRVNFWNGCAKRTRRSGLYSDLAHKKTLATVTNADPSNRSWQMADYFSRSQNVRFQGKMDDSSLKPQMSANGT